jgi:rare lipoprotein A (peptidoglycan hydrolase)
MAAMNFLKKAACWTAVFLCILFIGSAMESLGRQPADAIHSGDVEIIGMFTKSFSGGLLISPSAALPKKAECLTPVQAPRLAFKSVSGEVTVSWYGPKHHKKSTANGQRFNMYKNTLAHRTLPFGTKVRLVNLDNGKSAEGVVNDRGPYIKGRDVDISFGMAKQLGIVKKGIVKLYLKKI